MEEVGLAVEAEAGDAVHLLDLQGAEGEVGLDLVLARFHGELVEVGILGTPQARGGDIYGGFAVFKREGQVAVGGGDGHGAFGHALGCDGGRIFCCIHAEGLDIGLGDGLQPDSLPDARYGGVPHTAAVYALFAVGGDVVQAVNAIDFQDVFGLQILGNVEGKGFVPSPVLADGMTVQANPCIRVRGTEMQQHPAPVEALGEGEGLAVFHENVVCGRHTQTRQKGLGAEGNTNGSGRLTVYGYLPLPVEAEEGLPLHLGSWIGIPRNGGGVLLQSLPRLGQEVDELLFLTHGRPPLRSFSS